MNTKKRQFNYRTFNTTAIFDVIRSFSERNGNKKTGNLQNELKNSGLVLERGLEPLRPKTLEFESSASTNSATRAIGHQM